MVNKDVDSMWGRSTWLERAFEINKAKHRGGNAHRRPLHFATKGRRTDSATRRACRGGWSRATRAYEESGRFMQR